MTRMLYMLSVYELYINVNIDVIYIQVVEMVSKI